MNCYKYGHSPSVVGRPGNFTSGYVCMDCGDWKSRLPAEDGWHSVFDPQPVWGLPIEHFEYMEITHEK